MGDFAAIFFGACLVNNLILDSMLGVPPAVALSKKTVTAAGMAMAMSMSLPTAAVITYPVYFYVLVPFRLENTLVFSFILIIILVIKLGELILGKIKPELHNKIADYIPLVLINSSVLGLMQINIQEHHGIAGSLFFGLGSAAGFGLVIITMSIIQDRMVAVDVPRSFRGIAITLITLGIMSMAFMGFNGIFRL